jgi:hypothetical protein
MTFDAIHMIRYIIHAVRPVGFVLPSDGVYLRLHDSFYLLVLFIYADLVIDTHTPYKPHSLDAAFWFSFDPSNLRLSSTGGMTFAEAIHMIRYIIHAVQYHPGLVLPSDGVYFVCMRTLYLLVSSRCPMPTSFYLVLHLATIIT